MIELEDLYEPEWVAWFRMTPQERWEESARLWHHYIAMGGSLDPEPDPQSPSTIRRHQVAHLLMGGQACVLYGAAEFSRDLDLACYRTPPTWIAWRRPSQSWTPR